MMRELFLLTKHPYASGIIATQWIGTLGMFLIDRDLPVVNMVMVNMGLSFVVAVYGFRTGK